MLFRSVDPNLLIRHIYVIFNHVYPKGYISETPQNVQLDLFTDYRSLEEKENKIQKELEKETRLQQSILALQKKYGKNAVLKGMNLQNKATQKERNEQIGGHKS